MPRHTHRSKPGSPPGPLAAVRAAPRPALLAALLNAALLGATPAAAAPLAPAVSIYGSFFPSWLICIFIGVIGTVVVRIGFVMVGLDDILRWRVPAYTAVAVILTMISSQLIFGR